MIKAFSKITTLLLVGSTFSNAGFFQRKPLTVVNAAVYLDSGNVSHNTPKK